ncbi:MAG: hypothetical protein GC191_18215 [Azospirillum sp.]|nr:hypothetical protein [Azospirillum sp.]
MSTDGQSVEAQLTALTVAGEALMVTRLDRLARSTLDLLHTLKAVADKGAGFCSLAEVWADTTTAQGQSLGRPFKLTDHQKAEAIQRREAGEETLAEIGRSYNISGATLSRLST